MLNDRGEKVRLAPLVFGTVADQIPGIERFQTVQTVQTTPTALRLRIRPAAGADPEGAWQTLEAGIKRLLCEQGLNHVTLARGEELPEQSSGGKYQQVIPLG